MDNTLERTPDIVYGHAGRDGRALHGDLVRPRTGNGAAVLAIHGGGWRQGSRATMAAQVEALARAGYTCLAIEYRLTPEAAWPAQVHDCKAALRYLRANAAALGVDASKVCALGNSAGGHLALLLAGTEGDAEYEGDGGHPGAGTQVAAVVAVYPPTRFYRGEVRPSGGTAAAALLGDVADAAPAAVIDRLSPIRHARADFPPTFLLHGTADKVVPPSASLRMFEALAQAGAPVELHLYAGQPHGWARRPEWVGPTMAEAIVFLGRHVGAPQRYATP